MAQGPLIIFDKSALQQLSVGESAWLDNFFRSNITPLFFVETLADLEKQMKTGRTAEFEVKLIAARTPEQNAVANVHHQALLAAELAGSFRYDNQTPKPVLGHGQPRILGESKAVIYTETPEEKALNRWQRGEFLEIERSIARGWRAGLAELNSEEHYQVFKQYYGNGRRPRDLASLNTLVNTILALATQDWILGLGLVLLGISDDEKSIVKMRWELAGKPPIREFLPYFFRKISRIYTTKMASQFEADLRQLKAEYKL
jgi:hypothetical protein